MLQHSSVPEQGHPNFGRKYSHVRCNEYPEPPAREDAFDLLERQLGLGLVAEPFDSLDAVANVLLKVSYEHIKFKARLDLPRQTSRMLVCCAAYQAIRRIPREQSG